MPKSKKKAKNLQKKKIAKFFFPKKAKISHKANFFKKSSSAHIMLRDLLTQKCTQKNGY
jgi:hypothetical protein